MAFAIRNLSVLAYANGFTLWHYKTAKDTLALVEGVNYFADASDMLASGDMIMVSGNGGGKVIFVASADAESVIISPMS